MSKHTPKYASGPWYAFAGYDAKNPEYTVEGPESTLAFIRPSTSNPNPEATAQIMASALDLLEFVEEVRRTGDTRLASMAIAVIAKATGEI